MEKPRFTKIHTDLHSQHSEHIASSLLDHLLQDTALQVRQKEVESKQVQYLTQQIMKTEVHTLGQAVTRDPSGGPLPQDPSAVSHAYDPKRPMSAKITHTSKKLILFEQSLPKKPKKTNYSRTCTSAKPTQNYLPRNSSSKRYNFQKENLEKYFPLTCKASNSDSFDREEQLIAEMRVKKIRESEFQRSKTKFFNTVANEEEKAEKVNKRFIQLMGSKTYYYNSKGEAVEVQPPTGLRKGGASKLASRMGTTKMLGHQQSSKKLVIPTHQKQQSIYVQFKPKHSNIRSSLQAQILNDRDQILFFKSNQCQYKIIS